VSYAARKLVEARERGDAAGVRYWERIRALIDDCPPLTPEQQAALRAVLRPPLGRAA
jgi:hypothetical protein